MPTLTAFDRALCRLADREPLETIARRTGMSEQDVATRVEAVRASERVPWWTPPQRELFTPAEASASVLPREHPCQQHPPSIHEPSA